jgi:hypothetical protein
MFVFELPDDIVAAILSSWVNTRALTKLDTALCTSAARLQLLTLIRKASLVAVEMSTLKTLSVEKHIHQFEWLMERQMKVRGWVVNKDVVSLRPPLLVKCLAEPHVRSVQLNFWHLHGTGVMQSVTELLSATSNLTTSA